MIQLAKPWDLVQDVPVETKLPVNIKIKMNINSQFKKKKQVIPGEWSEGLLRAWRTAPSKLEHGCRLQSDPSQVARTLT